MRRLLATLLSVLLIGSSAISWADEDAKTEDDKAQELEQGRRLCVSANPEQLQKLLVDRDDGIALRAAWEKVRRQLAADIIADGNHKEGSLFKGADQFVAFLEGRLRVPVPCWWASELARARARELEKPEFFNGIDTLGDVYRQIQNAPRGISAAFGIVPTVQPKETGGVKVAWDKGKVEISAKQIPNSPVVPDLMGLVYRDRCLLARYDRDDFPWLNLEIYCVDAGSSRIVWSSKRVFGERLAHGGRSGSSIHHIALVGRDDTVAVFGMEFSMIYIETFRLSDGRPLMRFNSTY
jgi:hypothetical protein